MKHPATFRHTLSQSCLSGARSSGTFLLWLPCLFLVFASVAPLPALAQQKQTEHQQLVWFRYAHRLKLSEKLEFQAEADERRFISPWRQHQLVFHLLLKYRLSKGWETAGGFTYFLQWPQDPRSESGLVVPELRPFQDLHYRSRLSDRWTLRQRLRVEERFFRKTEDNHLAPGYDFNFRFRIKADLYYTLLKKQDRDLLQLVVSDEVMFNAGKRIVYNSFDQNRIYGALRYSISKAVALEAGYLYWFQQRPQGHAYFHRDIIRFSLFHYADLTKEKP